MTADGVPPARTALVTGAGRGIGRAVATGLAERGWSVGLLARDAAALNEVAALCRTAGGTAIPVAADVADPEAVAAAVGAVETELGAVGLLVNNAGAIEPVEEPFLDTDPADTWRVIEVNLRGPLLVTHAVLPGMLAAGGGRVVNISSGMAYRATSAYTGYAISKGALARFTAQLAAQYGAAGVRAFDLAPGTVRTVMSTSMPVHAGFTGWTPPERAVELVAAIGEGTLDELTGRFFRAGTDTPESLLALRDDILAQDARVLRLPTAGPDDPL
ncbi:SDR family NAD(P)-dependent oxidoreductase [Jiangella muralis]|uniref:SDR family NAD(P)-dependent oxidoreductase n=1 Tax=Jiangella muralis TaxID=702383 RepID=UPI00069E88EF|nr:SDR family oxidoreductase [Jiangella muralis]